MSFSAHQPRRRDILRLLGAGTAAALLGGCGTPDPTGDLADARLSAIMRGTRNFIPVLEAQIETQTNAWAEAHNATVTLRFGQDWRERYGAVAKARRGEDLAEFFGVAPLRYARQLVDVSELAERIEERHGQWMDAARQTAFIDGVWRAIPWAFTGHGMNYRQDIFDAAGSELPQSYDDLLDCATRLHEQRLPPVGFSMNESAPNDSANLAYSMLWAHGAAEVDESGKRVAIDSEATRRTLTTWRQLAQLSADETNRFDEGGNNAAFIEGRIAATQNASSIYWTLRNERSNLASKVMVARYPAGPAGHHQLIEINALGLFGHSRNPDAAISWIEAMTQEDQLRSRANESLTYFSPPLHSFVDDPDMPWNRDPRLASMGTMHDTGHVAGWPGPATVESALAYRNGTIVEMFHSVGAGTHDIDSAVRVAAQKLKRVYET